MIRSRLALVILLLICGIVVVIASSVARYYSTDPAPTVTFSVTGEPYLREDIALQCATASLAQLGYFGKDYYPVPDDRALAPDSFLVRNANDSNRGSMVFRNENAFQVVVRIWYSEGVVYCQPRRSR